MKRQARYWEKNPAKHISDKGLVYGNTQDLTVRGKNS